MNDDTVLRLAGVIRESVVDGPGWRFVVFAQGCPHRCEDCHNPETHDFAGGYETTAGKVMEEIKKSRLLRGVTLSGGEPFCQGEAMAKLAAMTHEAGLDVITYTGYTFEELLAGEGKNAGFMELLKETDILVDGKFIPAKKSMSLKFRGSINQRVIDVKASLKAGEAVETEFL